MIIYNIMLDTWSFSITITAGSMGAIFVNIFGDCWLVWNPYIRKLKMEDNYVWYMLLCIYALAMK